MQNWKIKRMGKKKINEWLKEIGQLLYYYQRKKTLDVCGLCSVNMFHSEVCLWKIIENSHCSNFKKELGLNVSFLSARNYKKWRSARIPMLRRWKKILRAELARRKQ